MKKRNIIIVGLAVISIGIILISILFFIYYPEFNNCEELRFPQRNVEHLTPSGIIMQCRSANRKIEEQGIWQGSDTIPAMDWKVNWFIFINQWQIKKLATKEDFISFFSPVDNPEEALSFVSVLTGYAPVAATQTPDGFSVEVSDLVLNCINYETQQIQYSVSKQGEIKEIFRSPLTPLPKNHQPCWDI